MSYSEIQERNSYVCQYCRGINTMALGNVTREKTEQFSFKLTPYTFAVASTIKGQYRTWENTFRQLIDAWMHSTRSQESLVKIPMQMQLQGKSDDMGFGVLDGTGIMTSGVYDSKISDIQEEEFKRKRKKSVCRTRIKK